MFHTLFELNEREKNKPKPKKKNVFSVPKDKSPQDNYYGKGNKAYDHYNKKPAESLNVKFEKTKNKITLIVFQNGFILNNGPFRDRALPENNKFMEEVERGNIPHEFTKKGINDLGILLINRKNEIYYQPYAPITQITQITQINPINPITINPPMNNTNSNPYNQFINFEFDKSNNKSNINNVNKTIPSNIINNYSVNNYNTNYNIQPYKYDSQTQKIESKYKFKNKNQFGQYQFQDPLFVDINDNSGFNGINNIPPQTPMGNRKKRKEIFIPSAPFTEKRSYNRYGRFTHSVPKKEVKNTFGNFQFPSSQFIMDENLFNNNVNITEQNEVNEYTQYEGISQNNITSEFNNEYNDNIEIQGFDNNNFSNNNKNIETEYKNEINMFSPSCLLNIRLYTGENLKPRFNYSQTLSDIYYYIKRVSGIDNFTMVEGFPPQSLTDYEKTIGELRLDNTIITQRIN